MSPQSKPSVEASATPPSHVLSQEALRKLQGKIVTAIGFGSLLSETSARSTFPQLVNFRFGRVNDYRRVFRHPAAIFFERGIARPATLEIASLSAEPGGEGFVCSLFEIPDFQGVWIAGGLPFLNLCGSADIYLLDRTVEDYVNREEEFDFTLTHFTELRRERNEEPVNEKATGESNRLEGQPKQGRGLMCIVSTDEQMNARWGQDYVRRKYGVHGVDKVWGYDKDSGILPCPVYLRHCVLAAQKAGEPAYSSFLRETFLADRRTTIEEHLSRRPDIMLTVPPASVASRYTG